MADKRLTLQMNYIAMSVLCQKDYDSRSNKIGSGRFLAKSRSPRRVIIKPLFRHLFFCTFSQSTPLTARLAKRKNRRKIVPICDTRAVRSEQNASEQRARVGTRSLSRKFCGVWQAGNKPAANESLVAAARAVEPASARRKSDNRRLLGELRDPVRQPGNLAAGGVAMNDALLRGADDGGLRLGHCGGGGAAVAGGNRLFDFAHRGAHARTARLVDRGAARDLAGGLLG